MAHVDVAADTSCKSWIMTRDEKLKDIRLRPNRHQHDFEELQECCRIRGVIDVNLMDEHEKVFGKTNGGRRCDVTKGPCSCGALH